MGISERNRRYRERYPERHREQGRRANAKRRRINSKGETERVRAWRIANKERDRENGREAARRRRTRLQGGRVEPNVIEYVRILEQDPCSYCGQPSEVIDHIDPLAQGGDHTSDNITASCNRCNGRKLAKPLLLFLCEIVL